MADISVLKLPDNTTYDIKDVTARNGLASKQDTLVSGTNIKTINNVSILGSGNITAGGGDVGHDDTVATGNPVTINADTLQGYQASAFVKTSEVDEVAYYTADTIASGVKEIKLPLDLIYPVGSVYMSINNTNPGTIFGGTWELISSVALASENVFGNGKTLGLANGGSSNYGLCENTSNALVVSNGYGTAIGSSTSQKTAADNIGYGLVTKTLAGNNPEYSGVIADTIAVYSWKRTA